MEYGTVTLAGDFPSELDIKRQAEEEGADLAQLNEEINTLYVAVTRAINRLEIPKRLVPKDYESCRGIEIIEAKEEPTLPPQRERPLRKGTKGRRKSRKTPQNAHRVWSQNEDYELQQMDNAGISIPEIAEHFGRSKMAIWMRLKKIREEGY